MKTEKCSHNYILSILLMQLNKELHLKLNASLNNTHLYYEIYRFHSEQCEIHNKHGLKRNQISINDSPMAKHRSQQNQKKLQSISLIFSYLSILRFKLHPNFRFRCAQSVQNYVGKNIYNLLQHSQVIQGQQSIYFIGDKIKSLKKY